jgi:dihydropteroate synthase-like protein
MDKILLATGRIAEKAVRSAAGELKADVIVLPVDVAQFISPALAVKEIQPIAEHYDRIIFPGATRFDVGEVEKDIGTPCFKGTNHPSDLPEAIRQNIVLSKKESADKLIEKDGEKEAMEARKRAEKQEGAFKIRNLKIGPGLPPRIIAEIIDAPKLSDDELLERAEYYLKSGADIIDIGAVAGEDNSGRLAEIVKLLKKSIQAPVSIDSLNAKEINACLKAGADLVLSLSSKNISVVRISDNTSYVCIPDEDITLDEITKKAEDMGFKRIISDPILHPPFNTAFSIAAYSALKDTGRHPILMGAGNVVELTDADSIGMNAFIAAMAVELDASLILTTEHSQKTRNSVREMKRAIDMCFLAKSKGTVPKDLGIDLLLAKAKGRPDIFDLPELEVVSAQPVGDFISDPKGHFKISVDFDKEKIMVLHYTDRCDQLFEGDKAESLAKAIIEKGIVSRLDHAAYLGRELQKAEISLKLKKAYVQDEDFRGL